MGFARIKVPAAPVRRKARHQAEMVNQLLFGEAVRIIKEKRGIWVKVQSLHDQYEGWLTSHMLEEVKEEEARLPAANITAGLFDRVIIAGQPMIIPAGSILPQLTGKEGRIGGLVYEWEGALIQRPQSSFTEEQLWEAASAWLNAPYLWGGRTLMGVDCSGFAQVIFRLLGVDLMRDAWQQAQEGDLVAKFREAIPGDLAFFDDRDEIVHVGILLSGGRIIHSAGKVRIDNMDKKGIINTETGRRTHSLRVIKRTR